MPPEAAPAKPKGIGKGLPKWAWVAAAGAGLLIGFVLLKKTGTANAADTAAADASGSSGALDQPVDPTVVAPGGPDQSLLGAMGLQPPANQGGFSSSGGGNDSTSSGGGTTGQGAAYGPGGTDFVSAPASSGQRASITSQGYTFTSQTSSAPASVFAAGAKGRILPT